MKERRFLLLFLALAFSFLVIFFRFFYWQVIAGEKLSLIAQKQSFKVIEVTAPRGKIYTADGYPLVLNDISFSLYTYLPNCQVSSADLVKRLAPILAEDLIDKEPSTSANLDPKFLVEQERKEIEDKISSGKKWLILKRRLTGELKAKIDALDISCLGFEQEAIRNYPEGSMSAQLLGFLGYDQNGKSKGYFGLEGFYDQQLSGLPGLFVEEKTIIGQPIFSRGRVKEPINSGLNLTLYLDQVAQFVLEEELSDGIKRYGATSGWGLIISPYDGGILAMASFPNYHPAKYYEFSEDLFSNPVISEGFEPGSIFKPLVMASALEDGVVAPETRCTRCDGPRKIGEYEIKTWNEKYHPNSTMSEVIQNSDNIGMVFVAEELGKKRLIDSLEEFGFAQKTGIDLQGEMAPSMKSENQWYPIDLATVSFGQGISVTPIQMVTSFTSLANNGWLIKPKLVKRIWTEDKDLFLADNTGEKKVISPKTAEQIKEMLINAVENGEAKKVKTTRLVVAGKTGTAQIPIRGHYDEEKTIASFIGFAPADKPKFVMLISLKEPTSSPWGSETAAPVWFRVAERLAYYWNLL